MKGVNYVRLEGKNVLESGSGNKIREIERMEILCRKKGLNGNKRKGRRNKERHKERKIMRRVCVFVNLI